MVSNPFPAVAIGFLAFLAACSDAPTPAPPAPSLPQDEAAFVAAKDRALTSYDQAPNDIAKSQIETQWEKDVCGAIASPQFGNWRGTITGIVSSPDGVIIGLGDGVEVEARLTSGDIDRAVAAMREGENVVFSGSFMPSDDNSCAVRLIGLPWGDGRIRKPDFDIQLTSISAG